MGCKQTKQVPKVNKDVEVRRKLQIGLHLTKEEAGVQVAFGKTSRKKYETPSESPARPQGDTELRVPFGSRSHATGGGPKNPKDRTKRGKRRTAWSERSEVTG